jgi:hypothetical protein
MQHPNKTTNRTINHRTFTLKVDLQDIAKMMNWTIDHRPFPLTTDLQDIAKPSDSTIDHFLANVETKLIWHDTWVLTWKPQ